MPLWVSSAAAARQFHAREGDLNVPHKPVEDVGGVPVKLGGFLDNTRRRASKLTLERHAELDARGMCWSGGWEGGRPPQWRNDKATALTCHGNHSGRKPPSMERPRGGR
ncbi:helicase associated domain-containing protein [Streptomyces mirabilis]|uniref:helicase associated domain-containing protein n=1 Tax=Streptomyces mirabilis TaxID=68239 RepID=UPI0036EC4945